MVHLIESGRTYARIRASWRVVQRACWDQNKRYSRKCHLTLGGEANLLVGGCKGYMKSNNGIWVLQGYAADGSDVKQALAAMKVSWAENEAQKSQTLAA